MTKDQRTWRDQGYLILPNYIPHRLVDEYVRVRTSHGEYHTPIPYMQVPQIRDLCLYPPLMRKLRELIGDRMGLHLNLTGWVSTERNWHQDDYLNPPNINGWYLAVWFALDTIHPDSGPFEYVPGSHKWDLIRRDKVLAKYPADVALNPAWPKITEPLVKSAMEEKIAAAGLPSRTFLGQKGDVLIWHGRLAHRGTAPNVPGMERRTIISHYSALSRRVDMPNRAQHTGGGHYFVL